MSTVLGGNGLSGAAEPAYMSIADFGDLSITLTPTEAARVYSLDIGAANRMEAISMTTQPGETVDQFIGRLRGCLRALWQAQRKLGTKEQKLEARVTGKVMEQIKGQGQSK